ncbi:MAG: hypothetical protein FWD77_11030, partial [Betaproteobacteria bacterium]|nr:hypothetical protein [Betaproteobacteria bacterium]
TTCLRRSCSCSSVEYLASSFSISTTWGSIQIFQVLSCRVNSLSGLEPATSYRACFVAANAGLTSEVAQASFTTTGSAAPVTPVLSALTVSEITDTSARFSLISTNTAATGYWFVLMEPGSCPAAADLVAAATTAGYTLAMGNNSLLGFTLIGFTPTLTYRFCFVAVNAGLYSAVAQARFTTPYTGSSASPVPPVLSALSLSGISSTGATFSVTSTNTMATAYWQLIPQADSCTASNILNAGNIGAMNNNIPFTGSLSGLSPNTAYRLCFIASSGDLMSGVAQATFSTASVPVPVTPTLSALSLSGITDTGVSFSVTSTNTMATGYWQLISQANTCSASNIVNSAMAAGDTGAMGNNVAFSRSLGNLSPSTAYRLCFIASNAGLTSAVAEAAFSTAAALPVPPVLSATRLSASSTGVSFSAISNQDATPHWRIVEGQVNCPALDTSYASAGTMSAGAAFEKTLPGLNPASFYTFCFVAENANGASKLWRQAFSTPSGYVGGGISGKDIVWPDGVDADCATSLDDPNLSRCSALQDIVGESGSLLFQKALAPSNGRTNIWINPPFSPLPAPYGKSLNLRGNTITVAGEIHPLTGESPYSIFGALNLRDHDVVEGNSVVMTGETRDWGGPDVTGGYAETADVTGNSIVVNNASNGWVIGGYAETADVTGNSVVVKDSGVQWVAGGYSVYGDATNNSISIINSFADWISGGGVAGANATGNTVRIVDSMVIRMLIGGDGDKATDNTVILAGSMRFYYDTDIRGGTFNGNTFRLENFTEAESCEPPYRVIGFQFYEFLISDHSEPLRVWGNVDFTDSDSGSLRSSVTVIDLAPGVTSLRRQRIPLICAENGFVGTIRNAGETLAGSNGYRFRISQEADQENPGSGNECLYATVVSGPPASDAPRLSAQSLYGATADGASFSVTSDQDATPWWKVIAGSVSCPALDASYLSDGSMSAGSAFGHTLSGLNPASAYTFCFAAENGNGLSDIWRQSFSTTGGNGNGNNGNGNNGNGNGNGNGNPCQSGTSFSDGAILTPGSSYTAPAGNSSFCLGSPDSAPVQVRIDNTSYTIQPRAGNSCLEIFSTGNGRALMLDRGSADISATASGCSLLETRKDALSVNNNNAAASGTPLLETRNGALVLNDNNATIRATVDPTCTSTHVTVLQGKVTAPSWITAPLPATGCPADAMTPPKSRYTFADGQLACNPSSLSLKGTYSSLSVKYTQALAAGQQCYVLAGSPAIGWFQETPQGWVPLEDAFLPLSTATQGGPQTTTVVNRLDVSSIPGTEVYFGCGTSAEEMLMNKRYCGLFKVAP